QPFLHQPLPTSRLPLSEGRPRRLGCPLTLRAPAQLCAARTPEAKEVSQTGRAYDWAREAPYVRTAARPRARAMEAQCLASDGRPLTACWRWVRTSPGSFSCSSAISRSRRASCGDRETARGLAAGRSAEVTSVAVSTELEGLPDQLTRVTARVPESTRTT